ncbi:two component transcriptional regulator, winged helix family [Denitrovibrio acetiphilus DSM 12809]|jgi:two-component system phosphate regulon response regulator OmpR|uniref:Two component transcriptional regulator, winged helix family n=1 Tax=Denitrovibrio acetiphilus (strain DSM 12809 / NBRC 114555 / N2460) TaxID=522772 RepID=D4H895_DENA2|nr:response regulator transcription factor [Denitrovibrio acetiphilus]ADD68244.1 two component transcriptional regulator, winged helix family [Denitrovibrio acetiphilus DSM 12809]
MSHNILIVDDDIKLCKMLSRYLRDYSYSVDVINNPLMLEKYLKSSKPSVIILDIMMPHINGFDLCKKLRKNSDIPVIMLSARGEVEDRIAGLEAGADDYLAKPFEPRELIARIYAVIKRFEHSEDTANNAAVYQYGELSIDTDKYKATMDGSNLELTKTEFIILSLMVRNPYILLSRDRLYNELTGFDCDAYNRTVDISVSRLRTKLNDDPKSPKYIKTVWGEGYMFIADKLDT